MRRAYATISSLVPVFKEVVETITNKVLIPFEDGTKACQKLCQDSDDLCKKIDNMIWKERIKKIMKNGVTIITVVTAFYGMYAKGYIPVVFDILGLSVKSTATVLASSGKENTLTSPQNYDITTWATTLKALAQTNPFTAMAVGVGIGVFLARKGSLLAVKNIPEIIIKHNK